MIYAKVDVKLRDHERAQRAGEAMATWTWGLLYAVEQETDGFIPSVALRGSWVGETVAVRHAKRLVELGLWEVDRDGWRICRYADKNATKAEVTARRVEAANRMKRVRANKERTFERTPSEPSSVVLCERSESEQRAVPGSGSGSGSVLGSRSDQPGRSGGAEPPDWFDNALETVQAQTGETLRKADCWLRYSGHRAGKNIAKTQQDAVYWLTTVMVREARDERQRATRQAERDAKFDRERTDKADAAAKPAPYHRLASVKPKVADEPPATPEQAAAMARRLAAGMFK